MFFHRERTKGRNSGSQSFELSHLLPFAPSPLQTFALLGCNLLLLNHLEKSLENSSQIVDRPENLDKIEFVSVNMPVAPVIAI